MLCAIRDISNCTCSCWHTDCMYAAAISQCKNTRLLACDPHDAAVKICQDAVKVQKQAGPGRCRCAEQSIFGFDGLRCIHDGMILCCSRSALALHGKRMFAALQSDLPVAVGLIRRAGVREAPIHSTRAMRIYGQHSNLFFARAWDRGCAPVGCVGCAAFAPQSAFFRRLLSPQARTGRLGCSRRCNFSCAAHRHLRFPYAATTSRWIPCVLFSASDPNPAGALPPPRRTTRGRQSPRQMLGRLHVCVLQAREAQSPARLPRLPMTRGSPPPAFRL